LIFENDMITAKGSRGENKFGQKIPTFITVGAVSH